MSDQTVSWMSRTNNTERGHACFCIGPQNGDPVCPCAMRSVRVRDGRYVQERDLGPAPGYGLEDDALADLFRDLVGDQRLGAAPAEIHKAIGFPWVTVSIGPDGARPAKPRHRVKAGRRVVP